VQSSLFLLMITFTTIIKKNIIDILKRYISFKKSDVIIYQKEKSIEILIETKNS